jgi:pimeloyl-ACP methyl ester carboxylesterase
VAHGPLERLHGAHRDADDGVVPIVGSPRVTAGDRLVYEAMRGAAEQARAAGTPPDSAWAQPSRIETLFMRTPTMLSDSGAAWVGREVAALAGAYRAQGWALDDYATQLEAMRRHDVAAAFGGDLARAAAAVRARMLVVYSPDDRMVTAGPAAEFARLAGTDTLVVRSACGHALFWCEEESVGSAVRRFVEREGDTKVEIRAKSEGRG